MNEKKALLLGLLFLFSVSLFAAEVVHVDNDSLKELISQGVPVIDVRASSEWNDTGVVQGSHLMMFYNEQGKYNLEGWLAKLATVTSKDKPVVLICLSGSRSNQLAKYLNKVAGYQEVYNVKKGIAQWIKENNPTVAPK